MGQMLIALIIIFSVLPVIFNTDPFIIKAGYSALWLMILYLIGGYIKKYGLFEKCRTTWLVAGYIIMALCSWGCKFAGGKSAEDRNFPGRPHDQLYFAYNACGSNMPFYDI